MRTMERGVSGGGGCGRMVAVTNALVVGWF